MLFARKINTEYKGDNERGKMNRRYHNGLEKSISKPRYCLCNALDCSILFSPLCYSAPP